MENMDSSIESKAVVIGEGGALYTADEVKVNFIEAALKLPGLDVDSDCYVIPEKDDENYSSDLEDMCNELDGAIANVGYTVVWNDGFVIYKDLTDEEAEYLNRAG